MKKIKLAYQLMLSYIAIIVLAFVMIFGFNHIMVNQMERHFNDEVNTRVESFAEKLVEYLGTTESINDKEITELLTNVLTLDKVRIFREETLIYEFKYEKRSLRPGEIELIESERNSEPTIISQFEYETKNGTSGYFEIEYGFSDNFNTKEKDLIESLSGIYRIVIVILTVIGLVLGFFMANGITNPIKKIGNTANRIQKGELDSRASIKSRTLEICELRDSINYLADTLEQEDNLRKQMTSDMAHEIRTPITNLRNFFEAFIDGVYEANNENLSKCYHEILRMNSLVEKLSDLARIEEHNIVMNNEEINLSEEVKTMVDLFKPRYDGKNIELEAFVDENVMVLMDPSKINQILSNLVSNAFRYTNEGGQVEVHFRQIKKDINIKVKDNGIGISKEDLPYVFERFYRTEKSRNRETGGMGVGLTMVKQLVESYGGTIKIESTEGVGTEVSIVIEEVVV